VKLVLTLDHRGGLGARETRTLGVGTISIGRAPSNDWVLADPDRHLSKTHCLVSGNEGRFELTDVSTNGVFVNGAREPLGRDVTVRLTDGDDFRLGDYVISVTELEGETQAAPKAQGASGPLGGAPDPLGGDLLDDPFALPPSGRPSAFPYPAAHAAAPVRMPDPFDLAEENQRRPMARGDDLFAGSAPADPWVGPSQPDNVDAPFQAFAAPKAIQPVSLDDLDIDALLGDFPPGESPPPAPAAKPVADPFAPKTGAIPPITPDPFAREPLGAADPFDTGSFAPVPNAPAPPVQAAPPPATLPQAPPVQAHAPATGAPVAIPVAAPAPANVQPPAAQVAPCGADAGLAAFLSGCGMPDLRTGGRDAEAMLRQAGEMMRVMVEGIRDVLMSRSAIKNELRVEQTMLRARDNNPLKFSVTAEEALAALLLADRPGYKKPLDATREAFDDIRGHELAVMAGVQTALIGLLKRFDPETLESRLQKGALDSFLPGARKSRNWELFCTTYKDIAREAEDDFQSVFGREFAKAYAAQVKKQ
jgi:type VI secretion system protein